jgi:hypothetical protein
MTPIKTVTAPPEVGAPAAESQTQDSPDETAAGLDAQTADASDSPDVYDSEARQRIPVTLLLEGEAFDVTLVCEPVSDAALVNYAAMCEQANAVESAGDEDISAAQLSGTINTAASLFNALMSDIEGVGEEGEEKPTDWRDIFGPREKATVIDRAIFGIEQIAPPPARKGARPKWGPSLRSVVTRLRVPFSGRMIDVSHTLRKADAKQLGEFSALYGRTLGMSRGGDAIMERLAVFYDWLHIAHAGYRGPVPMHHRAVALVAHLTRQGATVRKN